MSSPPSRVVIEGRLRRGDLIESCRAVLEALQAAGAPPVEEYAVPASGKARRGGADRAFAAMTAPSAAGGLLLKLAGGDVGSVHPAEGGGAVLRLDTWVGKRSLPEQHAMGASVCRHLLRSGWLAWAVVRWDGPGARCLPGVPIVGFRAVAVATADADVRDAYDDAGAFWGGWEHVERFDEKALLVRAMSATDGPSFLRAAQHHQWALARASRPGGVKFATPDPTDEERPIYRAGERTLQMVGYLPDERTIELSCVLQRGQHVNGWEIFDVWSILQEGALPGGQPVEAMRVVFLDEAAARAERRPLLDAGAQVFVQGASGDLAPIVA